jgi:cbb3-type cytochrome oxidase subunit 3
MQPSHDDTEMHLDLVDLATTMAFVVMSVALLAWMFWWGHHRVSTQRDRHLPLAN